MAGKILGGRYTVQDRIGTGGMAIVYRGLDEVLGRTVAIKTMLPQYAADPSFAARFKQEAQAAAALNSQYIVSVYDWGKDEDTYYIVMEYLRGTDLKSGIRKHGALECKKVAQIGSQIAQALSEAHRHEIIHRDIKPQNIMVLRDGNVKVMDFGIARAKNSHLTADNSVLGTAHYVSPEQTQGKDLGPTTDIYSLGIVMYEAATGQVPFDGDDAISVALKQVNEQPVPPSQLNPNIDPSLESIILKCMQKDPAARFQTADELYHVLRDYMAGRLQAVNAVTREIPVTTTVRSTTPIIPVTDAGMGRTGAGRTGAGRTGAGRTGAGRTGANRAGRGQRTSATERARLQSEERKRKARRRRRATLFGFLLLVAAIAAGVMYYINNANATRSVPNLLNYTQAAALAEIDGSDFFKRGNVTEEYSTTVEKGHVISQSPSAGKKAERNTKINLVISRGEEPKETVKVPDLKNMLPSEAQAALAAVGLKGESGDSVFDKDVETGRVAKQSPAADKLVKEGDTVTFHLSKGTEMVEVPNVVGEYQTTATTELQNAGFEVEVDYDSSDIYETGCVIEQSKTGTAEKGSTIRIVISTGRSSIPVPNVVGQDQATAVETLQEAGFSVTIIEEASETDAGTVIDQTPYGEISPNDEMLVTIKVSTGPAQDNTQTDTNDDNNGDNQNGDNQSGDNQNGDNQSGDNTSDTGNNGSSDADTGTESSDSSSTITTTTTP